jgi:hypothetical protein
MNLYSSRSNSGKKKISCYIKNILKYNESDLGNKFKKIKLKSKIETNSILNKFHRKIIEKKYKYHTRPKLLLETENSSDFFLTKLNKSQKNNNQTTTIFSNRTRTLSDRNPTIIKNLKLYTSKININNVYPTIEHKMPFRFNKMISSCLESSERRNFNKETLSQFNQRIKTSYLFNITQQNLLKRYNEIKENKDFKIQEVKMKIFMIEDCKKKLEIFIKNLNKYVNFLYHTINKEKNIINQLYSQECELEISNLRLFNLIKQKKLLLELYKQYKIFLILVKYKKTKIGEIPEKELKKYGIELEKEEPKPNILPRKSAKRMSNLKNPLSRRGSTFDSTKNLFKKNTPKNSITRKTIVRRKSKFDTLGFIFGSKSSIPLNFNIPIFESVDEFIEKFNFLENTVRELFNIFSDQQFYSIELLKEKDNESYKEKALEKLNQEIMNNSMTELNTLKEKNLILRNKYNQIMKNYKVVINEKLYNKIKKILISLPINIEIDFNIINFYTKINNVNNSTDVIMIKGKKYNKYLYCLSVLERIMIHYLSLIRKSTFLNPKTQKLFYTIKNDIDRKKRVENNKNRIMKQRRRIEEIGEKVLEKNKKIIIPMKKKYDIYEDLFIKRKKEKEEKKHGKNNNKESINIYENWIIYK